MSRHLSYFCHFAADSDGYGKGNVIMSLRKQQTELASLHPVEFLPPQYSISVRLVLLLPFLRFTFHSTQFVQPVCKFQATRKKIQLILTLFKECHPRCVYQIYNRLIINNGSQKHNYICKYNNLPTTCFGLIRPSSGWNTASEENYLFDLNAFRSNR